MDNLSKEERAIIDENPFKIEETFEIDETPIVYENIG
jgi:hypothetical protein